MLARQRSERGISRADVAARLKYGVRQIEALEADDYARLGGATFVRGMLRAYAKLLDMEPGPVLAALDHARMPDPVTLDLNTRRIPFPDGRRRSTRLYLGFTALALLAVAALLVERQWGDRIFERSDEVAVVPSQSSPRPVAEPAVPPPAAPAAASPPGTGAPRVDVIAPAPADVRAPQAAPQSSTGGGAGRSGAGQGRLVFEFQRESWVEIRDRRGRILLSQLNPVGAREVVEGEAPFDLVIGNAHGVRLNYNDSPVDLRPHTKVEVARMTLP